MSGETDLAKMLSSLRVSRRPETYTVVTLPQSIALAEGIEAVISETEGTTAIVTTEEAERRGWPVGFRAAWLTIEIHSALEAVGLTAAMATALGARGIPCNVLAGYYHDHLLVPVERVDEAIAVLENLG